MTCVLCFITITAFAGGGGTKYYYSKATADLRTGTTGSGKVYVNTTEGAPAQNSSDWANQKTATGVNGGTSTQIFTYYFYAKADAGSCVYGWHDAATGGNRKSTACDYYEDHTTGTKSSDGITRYAEFRSIVDMPNGNEIIVYLAPDGSFATASVQIKVNKSTALACTNPDPSIFSITSNAESVLNEGENDVVISVSRSNSTAPRPEVGERKYSFVVRPSNSNISEVRAYNPKDETIYITVREAPRITFKPVTVGGSYTYQQINVNAGKVTVDQERTLVATTATEGVVQLVATATTNYRFSKWVIKETNADGSITTIMRNNATETYNFTRHSTVEAEFKEDKYARFAIKGVDGVFYDDLTEGIAAAQSSSSKVLYVYQSGDLAAGNYTIPNGVTVLVPGDDACTVSKGDVSTSDFMDGATRTAIKCKKYLTMEGNTRITIEGGGALSVYAKMSKTQPMNGTPYSYGRLSMGDKCYITIEDKGILSALGYITGNPETSSITANSGASVYESFQIPDWRGGGGTLSMLGVDISGGIWGALGDLGKLLNPSNEYGVFPVGQYYVQNIETKLIVCSGAIEKLVTGVGLGSFSGVELGDYAVNAPFIVPDEKSYDSGLFRLGADTRLTKYYDRQEDRLKLIVESETPERKSVSIDKIKLTIPKIMSMFDVTVNSEAFVLPINNNMDVEGRNVQVTCPWQLAFLAGSTLTIDKNSEYIISNNQYIYDADQSAKDGVGYWSPGNNHLMTVPYTPDNTEYVNNTYSSTGTKKRTVANLKDAQWVINGQVTIAEGGLYTTVGGADITSDGNGKVYYGVKGTLTATYQAHQSGNSITSWPAISITNAKLHNDEEKNPTKPYSAGEEVDGAAEPKETYTYVQSLGIWMLPQELQITNASNTVFKLTLPNDLTQNVVCDVDTESPDVSLNNFEVILPANSRFTKDDVKYENKQLTIQLTYDAQNKHNVDNPYEETITVRCKDIASETFTDVPIVLTAEENYQPVFKVTIDGEDYSDGSTYPLISGVNVDREKSFNVKVSADANNVANALAEWTKACVAPFTFDYGTKTETPYENATFKYLPTTAGSHTGDLSITATYTDAAGVKKDSTITIHFSAVANRLSNPLAFTQFPQPIYTTTSPFELIDAATNVAGADADIDVTPKTGVVNITGTGKLDDPYIVTPNKIGVVTITATQEQSRVYERADISTTIAVIDPNIYPVPFCINGEGGLNEFNKYLFGGRNVSYNTTNHTVDFNSTTSNSEWIFRFNGTPDKLTFTPTGSNSWSVQQRSSENAEWKDILVWSSLTSGAKVSYQLDPTTCQVRIQYGSANPEVGTLENVCVSELLISADVNKLYLPIEKSKVSNRTIVLTHTQNEVPTITLTEGLTYTADKSDNLGTAGAPYYKTTVTISTTASTIEGEYTFKATEDGNTVTVIVSAYQFPQELPIKLATDKPDNGDRYYFVVTESAYAQWDASNRQIVFLNPGAQRTRSVTFAFNGAPSIISFDAYSVDGAEIIVDSVWTIEESVNGKDFYPASLPRDLVESNKLVQELNYTTRYVRVNYNSTLFREIKLSNLVIEGYPKVIVHPENLYFTPSAYDLNPKKLEVIAINLQEVEFELDNTAAFQISLDTTYTTSDWHNTVTANEATHESALGKNKVDTIFLGVKWNQQTIIDEGKLTIRNKTNSNILAEVYLIGSEGYLTLENANNTGLFTGIPTGYTYHGKEYKDYQHHPVNLTNAFAEDGTALFDYLFIYGETIPEEGIDITAPKGGSADGSKNIGSNAVTPYFVYKRVLNADDQYKGYQIVGKVDNANTSDKALISDVIIADTAGVVYIDAQSQLRVYMTGFCPYATTGYTKNQEGVFLFRGKHGAKLDIYLEDFHVSSRNKTKKGNGFYGDKEGGEIFTDGYARGSGGVLVFENVDPQEQLQNFDPFEVTIHTIGDNLLNSNYGCFFGLSVIQNGGIAMKAYQVSSPIQIHMFNKDYSRKTKTTLNFDDLWPTAVGANDIITKSKHTNGFLSLKKQANNAPSIDMGNKHTTVNFKGGRVELQNSQIGSDTYKTTLAISHRSGYFGSNEAGIQLCYGIGTDSVGGTVNFLDGTVTIKPMYVAPAYRQYYLMDVKYDAQGDTVRDASGNVVYSDSTSCLRAPMNTYVKGGSICRVRACQHVTSKGGAPKDGRNGKPLGQYVYTLQGRDTVSTTTNLAHIVEFPSNVEGLQLHHQNSGYTYGLYSVSPDKNNKFYFWIPDGYGGVTAEQDKNLFTWKACMTEIGAGITGIKEGRIGGDTPIEVDEEVKYFLYCQIDQNIRDVIRAGVKNAEGEIIDYTYQPPFEVPSAAKSLFNDATYARYDLLTYVSDSLQSQVTSDTAYTITDRVYYITTATADIWQTFAAPFDVENIYIMEVYSENALKQMAETAQNPRETILKAQAAHNADFAAFFAVAMAMGTDKDFDAIVNSYKAWAYEEDKNSGLYSGDKAQYNLRGKQELVPYVGSNWREANFYLNENKGNWTLNEETGYFDVNWETLTADSLTKDILLHKGKTYSLMFPYCPNCEEDGSLDSRTDWDYWSGKFLIFESTAGAQVINGRDFLNDTIAGNIFAQAPGETEVVVTGNSTFARLETNRENLYVYESGYPTMNSETFLSPAGDDAIIQPTTAFLYGYVPTNAQGMPAKAISRSGQIIYDKENTPTGNQGGNIPTVGGGNDLFITSTAEGINIAVAEAQHVRVMSATGAVLYNGMVQTAVDVALPANGVYVIAGENEVHKILH